MSGGWTITSQESDEPLRPCNECGKLTRLVINSFAFCPIHLESGARIVVELEGLRVGAPQDVVELASDQFVTQLRQLIAELQ